MLRVDDFDFALPSELIAQHPPAERGASRLLRVAGSRLTDGWFADLPAWLNRGDLLIFNDAKVIKARFFGCKASGGRLEVLLERILDDRRALAQMRASKSPKAGSRIELEGAFSAQVQGREGEFFLIELDEEAPGNWWNLAERFGRLPLPPYIAHPAGPDDEQRYQTVYAREPGAVAAPTAGLHFDEAMLARLAGQGIETAHLTLHVGAGTFQPVRVDKLADHKMHQERYEIPQATAAAIERARQRGSNVVAVGTTTLRALEAAAALDDDPAVLNDPAGLPRAGAGQTGIFITPGYSFRVVDRLLTNFHLPRSTLLMLVAAFAGFDEIRAAYAHAVAGRYRFFSYGDAMLLDRLGREN